MEWKRIESGSDKSVVIPESWLYPHYYEALNILFRFENSLRVFVYTILKNVYGNQWKEITFNSAAGEQKSIKNLASSRVTQAENFGYLGYDISCPIMHLNSGELVDLLTNESYWPIFRSYFKGKKDVIKNKLLEIGSIRNSLAHFRPIKQDDIEVIKQNSKQTLLEVEGCLSNIFYPNVAIPTNTDTDWYKELSVIGNDVATASLFYSKDEKWVNIKIEYKAALISKKKITETFYMYQVANLVTPNILNIFDDIKNSCIYISERPNYPSLDKDFNLIASKSASIIFSMDCIEKHYKEISSDMRTLIAAVSDEVGLLLDDNLARGKLVNSVSCTASWKITDKDSGKGFWNYSYGSMDCPYESNHPDEYWGHFNWYAEHNIVTEINRYPWMPADISADIFPF